MRSALVAAALALIACDGTILSAPGSGLQPAAPWGGEVGVEAMAVVANHEALGVRRLTRAEYGATVADLLGQAGAEERLPVDLPVTFFSNNMHGLSVSLPLAEAYAAQAQSLSAAYLAGLSLPGCDLDALSASCVDGFLQGFLRRAFRRPPTAAELERQRGLFATLASSGGTREALQGVVEAVLQSPSFLYRRETGTLDGYTLASRLSYMVWGSMPDDVLLAAAERGALESPQGRVDQLRRLWASPRSQVALGRFVSEWLGLEGARVASKDPSVLNGAPTTLQADLEGELQRLLQATLLSEQGTLEQLLAGKTTFVTPALASHYGLPRPPTPGFSAVSLEGTGRRGVLTSGLLLVAHSKESGYSIPQLGRFVRRQVLCQEIPPPPADVVTALPADFPAEWSYRQRFEAYTSSGASCLGCHRFINPAGFAFLPFDPVGRFSALDPLGKPFDTMGPFPNLDGQTVSVRDAADLAEQLAGSARAKACFTRMVMEYAQGRTLASEDLSEHLALAATLSSQQTRLLPLLEALVSRQAFTQAGPTQ